MFRPPQPTEWFRATAAGSSLAKTIFPGSGNTCTLPAFGSGGVAPIVNGSGATIGGVWAASNNTPSAVINAICVVSGDDQVGAVEFGGLLASGGMSQPLVKFQFTATAQQFEDINPVTGESDDGGIWNLCFSEASSLITEYGNYDPVYLLTSDALVQSLCLSQIDVSQFSWYYAISVADFTVSQLSVYITPTAFTFIPLPPAA
jgi:hypothetical protein